MPPTFNHPANHHPSFLVPGIIITVSILLAAGFAVYESPQVKEWFDNSRRKIAIALHSLGDEINPAPRSTPRRQDSSMKEDASVEAEERRKRARQEIMQRGRILEEKKRKSNSSSVAGSFDNLVDKDGNLWKSEERPHGTTSGLNIAENESLTHRSGLLASQQIHSPAQVPFETEFQAEYNRMMESTSQWDAASSHPSESLIDFTPTSEVPDPDISIPHQPLTQSDYFSLASSRSSSRSQTLDHEPAPQTQEHETIPEPPEYYYAHPSGSTMINSTSLHPNPFADPHDVSVSSAPSIAGSMEHVAAEIESSDSISEIGDGIATPASWTDVGSNVGSHTGSQV
jgi:hypothetical protein